MKIFLRSFWHSVRDLLVQKIPLERQSTGYKFGFLIHPRDETDVLKKYPFLKLIPKRGIRFFTRWYWPVVVTKVRGLKNIRDQDTVDGYIITIPLITKQILENRPLAIKRIRQAIVLARRLGVKIIGLGALTSSVTQGGALLKDIDGVWITTGHAYTGYNVTQNLFKLEEILHIQKDKDVIAIVGAAGSIGSISAQIIARRGYLNLTLIDLERKAKQIRETAKKLQELNPSININICYDIIAVKNADFVIAATNTPEALITPEILKAGAVVIDDAQPSDVSYEVLNRKDIMAIEAGVVDTPGITSNFNLGLKGRFDNFCCMAEVLILAAHRWSADFVIEKTTLEFVDKIAAWGEPLGFNVAKFQNRKELIPNEKLDYIREIRTKIG